LILDISFHLVSRIVLNKFIIFFEKSLINQVMNRKTELTDEDTTRYARQMLLSGWGEEGQQKLKEATVFVAGAGGLGSPVSIYLATAGVGHLRICDFGEPELSNLNRQILHSDRDIGRNKALSAKETIATINPCVKVESLTEKIDKENVARLVDDARIIVDCMDNFPTRHILNEYAVKAGIPFIHAGVYGMSGQMTFIHSPETACLYCILPGSPPSEVFPIVGATAGVIGTLEALEVLKYLTGKGSLLKNRMLFWDGEQMSFQEIPLQKDPHCPVCGKQQRAESMGFEGREFRK
jgi:molybdopterin/thiamine biosynthesis adenylyltransferase